MPKTYTYLFNPDTVREARLAAGLSIDAVAATTGYGIGGLKAAENPTRRTPINRAMLEALAALYGVRARSLMRTTHGRYNADTPRRDAPGKRRKKIKR